MSMFSNTGGNPHLIIIGKNTRLFFSYGGYIVEDDIRVQIEAALKEFGDLVQVEKLKNIYLKDSLRTEIGANFVSLKGQTVTAEIISNTDETIVGASIAGNELVLSRGMNTGISNIKIGFTAGEVTETDSFDVMVYPGDALIYDFEEDELWRDKFFLSGEGWWNDGQIDAFYGYSSLKTDPLPTPDYENGLNRSIVSTEFSTEIGDTISFAYKISSQYNSDGFDFYLDGEWLPLPGGKWSGEVDWSFVQYPVKPGTHTAEWDYFKFEYGYAGKDAAWLDLIRIPGSVTGIESSQMTESISLISNYPNPFNGSTVLSYRLERNSGVRLSVYNSTGQKVMEKYLGVEKAGNNSLKITFDGFESGIYYFNLTAGRELKSGKLLYIK